MHDKWKQIKALMPNDVADAIEREHAGVIVQIPTAASSERAVRNETIRHMLDLGLPVREVARVCGCSASTVRRCYTA